MKSSNKRIYREAVIELIKNIAFYNSLNKNDEKLYKFCNCEFVFHQNCLFFYIFHSGILQCKECLVIFKIKGTEILGFKDLIFRSNIIKTLIFHFICLMIFIILDVFVYGYNFSEKYTHLKYLFFIIIFILSILNLIFIIWNSLLELKKKVPKYLLLEKEIEENIGQQNAPQ
jgi:hypothetical protein